MKTAYQPAGGMATDRTPSPIMKDRPKSWYQKIQLYHLVVFGAYIVFLCNMAISYFHAWELFSQVGYFPGRFAHVAVIAFDTVFAIANVVISVGIMRKIKIGWQVWSCFLFGLLMTGWANVRASMGDQWILLVTGQWKQISPVGWESLISGLSTPTALVSIELLLFWMVVNRTLFRSTDTLTVSGKPNTLDTRIADRQTASPSDHQQLFEQTPNEADETPNVASEEEMAQKSKKEKEVSKESIHEEMVKEASTIQPEKQSMEDLEKVAPAKDDNQAKTPKKSEEEIPKSEPEMEKEKKEEKQPASLDEKRDEMAHVEKIARDIWKKEGKRPGRVKIETETGCSEKTSRKIAKKLLDEERRKEKAG